MSRKIKEIRSNIAKRKMKNKWSPKKSYPDHSLLEDEERYGYTSFPKADSQGMSSPRANNYLTKLLVSAIIVFLSFFIYQAPLPILSSIKPFVHETLTEDLPFAKVQAWYDEHFATSFLTFGRDEERMVNNIEAQSVPVSGLEFDMVEDYQNGVNILVEEAKSVYPFKRGSVLFAGKKPETGNTIIIQHEDGTKSVYGHLEVIDVFHYQFVYPNQSIATVEPDEALGYTNMYFAIQEGSQYIDPIPFILGDLNETE